MPIGRTHTGLAIALVMAAALVHVDRLGAQGDCAQAFEQVEKNLTSFENDVRKENMDFMIDGGVQAAKLDAGNFARKTTTPATMSAQDAQIRAARLTTVQQTIGFYGLTLDDLIKCLTPGSNCNAAEFVARQSEAFRKWVESMLSGGTRQALARTRAARGILDKHIATLGNSANSSTSAALKCLANAKPQPAATADPVPAANPPAGSTPSDSGMSTGTKALIVTGGAAGLTAIALKGADAGADAASSDSGSCHDALANATTHACQPFGQAGCDRLQASAAQCCHALGLGYTPGAASCG